MARHAEVAELAELAVRHRRTLVDVAYRTGGAYLAQALSGIDLMTAVLHGYVRSRPAEPTWPARDRFLLSPGHYALPLYVILSHLGYFPESLLDTFKEDGSPLELAAHRGSVPGVEVSGGSLGQVLSVGVGLALAARLQGRGHRIFVFLRDGEHDEGQIWEAAASAAHYGLGNLTAVIDKNGFQVDGPTSEVMDMEPLAQKYQAFRWMVEEVPGNDMVAVCSALDRLVAAGAARSSPTVLVGATVRGHGVSFMEGKREYHYARLDRQRADQARHELTADWDAL